MFKIAEDISFRIEILVHVMWKARALNDIGIKLIALNKFLSGYLDTEEPFPLTGNFIETVKKDVTNCRDLYGYSPILSVLSYWDTDESSPYGYLSTLPTHYPAVADFTPPEREEDLLYDVLVKLQLKKYEEYEEPIWSEVANLQISEISNRCLEVNGLNYRASVTSRKRYIIIGLIEYAVACFFYANTCLHMHALLLSDSPPATRQGEIKHFSDPLPGSWDKILDAADSCLKDSGYQIGYCTREIEILRGQKERMKESNDKKEQKYAEAKQRTVEIYNTIVNRSEILASAPYKLAGEIWNKLKAEGLAANELVPNKKKQDQKSQKRKRPRRDTILRWIKEETST